MFFFSLLLATSAQASQYLAEVTPRFELRGPECSALKTLAAQVCVGPPRSRLACTRAPAGGDFLVSIASCVPEEVKRLHERMARDEGPNCWGAAMAAASFRGASLAGGDDEFTFFVSSPLCRLVRPGEPLRKGDVGRILAPSYEDPSLIVESHGFLYLSEEVCFSKNGLAPSAPYLIQPCEDMLARTYHVEGECRHLGAETGACKARAQAFRCDTLKSYLKAHEAGQEWRQTLATVDAIERTLETFFLTPTLPDTDVRGLEASLTLLSTNLTAEVQARVFAKTHEKIDFFQSNNLLKAVTEFGFVPPRGFSPEDVLVFSLWFRVRELGHQVDRVRWGQTK